MMSLSKPFTISSIGSFKESGDRTSSPSVNSSFCKEIIAFKNSNEEKLFSSYKFFIKNNFCDNFILIISVKKFTLSFTNSLTFSLEGKNSDQLRPEDFHISPTLICPYNRKLAQ